MGGVPPTGGGYGLFLRVTTMPLKAVLFDLDNTLYSENCGIFDRIDRRMNDWLISRLDVKPEEVDEFRHNYFMKYGTTLRGLMLFHDVDPHDFLDYVHDVPVHEFLSADQELRKLLERIELRKVVFTNSNLKHANRVLDALGVRDLFERIYDIEAMDFVPKPNPEPYHSVLRYLNLPPDECLLIDDMERNLAPAREIGMSTILIGDGLPADSVHHVLANITELNGLLLQIAAAD
jgi:putative hydrolase of the HAD superfamily